MVNYATWCITLILLILFFFQVGCSWLPVCTRPGTWQCSSSVVWSDTSWSISLSCVTRHCAHHISWSLSVSVDSQLLSCRSSCDLAEQRVLEQESDHQPHVSTNQRWVLSGLDQSVTSILTVSCPGEGVISYSDYLQYLVESGVSGAGVSSVHCDLRLSPPDSVNISLTASRVHLHTLSSHHQVSHINVSSIILF